jgi:hypothetical protein
MNDSALVMLVGGGLSLGFLYRAATLVTDGAERVREFVLWISFAVGMVGYSVATVTGGTGGLTASGPVFGTIGIGDGWYVMVLLLIGGVLYLVGQMYTGVRTQKRETAELVREVALLRAEMEQHHDGGTEETNRVHDVTGLGGNGEQDRDEVVVVPGPGESSVDRPEER